jgi:hypothetical protein
MINEGIEGIISLLPNAEKQKGAILAQAANYIRELQEENRKNAEELALSTMRYESEIKDLQVGIRHRFCFVRIDNLLISNPPSEQPRCCSDTLRLGAHPLRASRTILEGRRSESLCYAY